MSAVAQRKIDEQRIDALALDATRGAARFFDQVQQALREPVTVADLLRYREDNSALVKTVDWSMLDRAKHAVRELEATLGPDGVVRDYVETSVAHKTVREVRAFVDEVCTVAEPLMNLRRKKSDTR